MAVTIDLPFTNGTPFVHSTLLRINIIKLAFKQKDWKQFFNKTPSWMFTALNLALSLSWETGVDVTRYVFTSPGILTFDSAVSVIHNQLTVSTTHKRIES